MVLLLDHEYSQNGLTLAGLKGRDALWASRLLSAAEASEHEAMLGLAEIHEIRDATIEDSYDDHHRGGWAFGWDEEFEDGFADEPTTDSDLATDGYLNRTETWPLAKPRRQHIHGMIDGQGLPVTHTTERTGSPHKLKLRKTDRLMKADAAERRYFETQLAWVTGLRSR